MDVTTNDITGLSWTRVPKGFQLGIKMKAGPNIKFNGFREQVPLLHINQLGEYSLVDMSQPIKKFKSLESAIILFPRFLVELSDLDQVRHGHSSFWLLHKSRDS